jgi:hypothetical protein
MNLILKTMFDYKIDYKKGCQLEYNLLYLNTTDYIITTKIFKYLVSRKCLRFINIDLDKISCRENNL